MSYIPKVFEANDKELMNFIVKEGFGQLITYANEQFFISPVPFLFDVNTSRLRFHLAKANPHWEHLAGQPSILTLTGPHHYISPSIYQSPGVPTWNYQVATIYGTCEINSSNSELIQLLVELTEKYESRLPNPWQVKISDPLLQAIVGVEMQVARIEGKFKLGQNRSAEDQHNIKSWLENQGANALADAMQLPPKAP